MDVFAREDDDKLFVEKCDKYDTIIDLTSNHYISLSL